MVMFTGDVDALASSATLTGQHKQERTRLKDDVREPTGTLAVSGANLHNLRDLSVEIPTGVVTVVSGVAGSGKSTLVYGVFCAQHPGAVRPGAPARRTPRLDDLAADIPHPFPPGGQGGLPTGRGGWSGQNGGCSGSCAGGGRAGGGGGSGRWRMGPSRIIGIPGGSGSTSRGSGWGSSGVSGSPRVW